MPQWNFDILGEQRETANDRFGVTEKTILSGLCNVALTI